jgi:hypothetical protein
MSAISVSKLMVHILQPVCKFYLSLSFLLLSLWSIGHPWNSLFRFIFLILRQSVGLLGRGSAHLKATTCTGQHKHRINEGRHSCLGWDSNPRSQCSTKEDSSCLRLRGHCDRQILSSAHIYFATLIKTTIWQVVTFFFNVLYVNDLHNMY